MDKTGIAAISLCLAALIGWLVFQAKTQERLNMQQALYNATNQVTHASQAAPANPPDMQAGEPSQSSVEPNSEASSPAATLTVTNGRIRYIFTSRSGGLQQVDLLDSPVTLSAQWRNTSRPEADQVVELNAQATEPVFATFGGAGMAGDQNFSLTPIHDGVKAEHVFSNGLVLTKEYHLESNYLVQATLTWHNPSEKPLDLPAQQIIVGTATPMDVDDTGMYLGVTWCDGTTYYDTPLPYFNTNTTTLGIIPRKPTPELNAGNNNVLWASAHSQFFTLLAMAPTNEPASHVEARPVSLPAFDVQTDNPRLLHPRGIEARLIFAGQSISANSSLSRHLTLFAGPKEFRTLSDIGAQMNNHADFAMNFGTGYAGFWGVGTFFAKILLSAMNWMHDVTHMGYGWTIVVITLMLRVIFWPFTAASMRSAKKMQALAPEVKALKEKYKDDPQKFTQKQMELWRKNKVNPMSGCLPMLIQMPVFFGFLAMIRCAIELRGAHFLWVSDLTKPDTLFMIPGLNYPFNLLPLLMVGTMVWQAHLQPPSPGMDESQQKMMRYMPLMFLVFLYNYSSAMALYMTISTLSGAIQTILTRVKPSTGETQGLTPAIKSKK